MKYTKDHEWVKLDGDIAVVGISQYAAGQLGDVVYVELPPVGKSVAKADEIAVVESVKAASDIYAPISGEVTEVNEMLEASPETVNQDPEDAGWFFKLRIKHASDLHGLMDAAEYKTYCDGLS